jgi:hypothetical protein
MNTYNDNLQDTVNKTLAVLSTGQARLNAEKVANDYLLYNAQGVEIKAYETQLETAGLEELGRNINHLVLLSELQISDLQLSATGANDRIALSVTNMATAAASVNIASNAVVALAADIGAALNNTIASLLDTEVYRQVAHANSCINKVASEAEALSRLAMDASSKASEVIIQSVLNETADVRSALDILFAASQATLADFSSRLIADNAAAGQALTLERQAEGGVKAIDSLMKANRRAYQNANSQLNMGLTIEVYSGSEIGVSFHNWSAPMPASEDAEPKNLKFLADKPYRLMLLPFEQATTFTIDQAEQLLERNRRDDYLLENNDQQPIKVILKKDVNGDPVSPGKRYVAYLHIELSMEYRRSIDNFANLLTSPSLPFIPATDLPLARKSGSHTAAASATESVLTTLHFSTTGNELGHKKLEFRCILIEEPVVHEESLMRDVPFRKASIYFNKDIALQVAPSNYVTAEPISASEASGKKSPEDAAVDEAQSESTIDKQPDNGRGEHYSVSIYPTTTDNFGNVLKPKATYKPYILTVINSETNEHGDEYVSALSSALDAITLPANH